MSLELTLKQPDDFHLHLRDGDVLPDTVAHASRYLGRVIVMPNTKPPVRNVDDAALYRDRILAALPAGKELGLLMTLYLTDKTTPTDIKSAKASGFVFACKLYPAGATTNSEYGVTSMDIIKPVLECMAEENLPLLVHGEVTDPSVDVFDREAAYIETVLKPLIAAVPTLRIVMEHITTQEAAEFVASAPPTIFATITAHHLLYNRTDIFQGGINPHMYCLPILKREKHRQALIAAAVSGNPKFFIGTDSAPHALHTKETSCGCAGIFTGHATIELYAEAFESAGALDKLEGFTSIFGAQFYGLPLSCKTISLKKEAWTVPESYSFGSSVVRPLRAGQTIAWKVIDA